MDLIVTGSVTRFMPLASFRHIKPFLRLKHTPGYVLGPFWIGQNISMVKILITFSNYLPQCGLLAYR